MKRNEARKESFEDRILLKIRRDLSESEAIKFVIQENDKLKLKLSSFQIKSGELKSDVAELQYQNERLAIEKEKLETKVKELQELLEMAHNNIPLPENWRDIFTQADRTEKHFRNIKG